MAKQSEISARRIDLKLFMVNNRDVFLKFEDIKSFYNNKDFIAKHGFLSDSRIREDLKALGVLCSKDNLYSLDIEYDIDGVESDISKSLFCFTIYRPMLIGKPINYDYDLDFEDSNVSNDLYLCSILLQYTPSTTRKYSKYTIDYLLKKIDKFYNYTINSSNFGYIDIIKNNNSIQFLFNDNEEMESFYYNLVNWKKSCPLIRKK